MPFRWRTRSRNFRMSEPSRFLKKTKTKPCGPVASLSPCSKCFPRHPRHHNEFRPLPGTGPNCVSDTNSVRTGDVKWGWAERASFISKLVHRNGTQATCWIPNDYWATVPNWPPPWLAHYPLLIASRTPQTSIKSTDLGNLRRIFRNSLSV